MGATDEEAAVKRAAPAGVVAMEILLVLLALHTHQNHRESSRIQLGAYLLRLLGLPPAIVRDKFPGVTRSFTGQRPKVEEVSKLAPPQHLAL